MTSAMYADQDSVDIVEARMLDGNNVTVVADWARAIITEEIDPFSADRYPGLNVQTPREVKRASMGDYVIKRPNGDLDVFKPIEFRARFKEPR